jgi:hypothetical protein
MNPRLRRLLPLLALLATVSSADVEARTVYRCVREGTVSLATAPEPGSRCTARELDDNAVQTPNLWGSMGVFSGTLYERDQDGQQVYSTRNLPGSRPYLKFTVATPPGEPAHPGLGKVSPPRLNMYSKEFAAAARQTGVEDAWLRAVAHAESDFDAKAVSAKGAQGLMQLMPELSKEYGVSDPFSSSESIRAGARHLKSLVRRYQGDLKLAAAAYNAGVGAVARYGGIPPYAETQAYVEKVGALHQSYLQAMGKRIAERPAE